MKKSLVLAAGLLLLGSTASMAQSLQNASFESLVLADGSAQRVNSFSLEGWTVAKRADIAQSQVKVRNPSDSNGRYATVGDNMAVVTNGASLSQSFATVAGTSYTFSFLWDVFGQDATLSVLNSGGSALLQTSLQAGSSDRSFLSNTVSFVATGALTTLSFMAGTPLEAALVGSAAESRLLLDGLQVTAVPEPSGLAMVLAGLGAMGLLFRRRRIQGGS